MSADTRIRASVIAAIENDDYGPCGGSVYARGHLRSIARVVGIDADPLVAEFDASHQVDLPPVSATVAPQPTDPDLLARTYRGRPSWTAAMVVALAAICVFAFVGLFLSNSGGGKSPQRTTALNNGGGQTSPPPSPPPTTVAEVPATKATLLVRAVTGTSWLQVTRHNGDVLFSQNVYPGHSKVFSAKGGLSFIIGNAPAVDVVVNGHDVGSPTSQGSVARGTVTPGADTIQQA